MKLKLAIEKYVKAHLDHGVRGTFQSSEETWPTGLPSSPEVDYWFRNYDPNNTKIESGVSPTRLFSVIELEKAQQGYRWHGARAERITTWPAEYLVIGDDFGGGKPLVAVTNKPGTPIFASYDVVQPFQIASSMAKFFEALSVLIEIVYGKYDIFEVNTEDETLKTEFVADVERALVPILGEEDYRRFFDYFYG